MNSDFISLDMYFPERGYDQSYFAWQEHPLYVVILPSSKGRRNYTKDEIFKTSKKYALKINRQAMIQYEITLWNINAGYQVDSFSDKDTVAIVFKKDQEKTHQPIRNKHQKAGLGAIYGNPETNSPGKIVREVSDSGFFETRFIPSLEEIFSKRRILTRESEASQLTQQSDDEIPVLSRETSIEEVDESRTQWVSDIAYDCKISSYIDGKFTLIAHENVFTAKEKLFSDFLNNYLTLDDVKHEFLKEDENFKKNKDRLNDLQQKMMSFRRFSPGNKEEIGSVDKEIQGIQNMKLIADGLYTYHRVKNWNWFKERVVEALKYSSEINEFYCVLQVKSGTLPDGKLIEKKTVKAIVVIPNLLKMMEAI